MSARPSLVRRVAAWFAATLVVLYGIVAVAIWAASRQSGRQYAVLSLETEAESVAGYIAARGSLDVPELGEVEQEPFPIWIRVISGAQVVAQTPGTPDVPAGAPRSTEEVLNLRPPGAEKPLLVVRHAVGGRGQRIGRDLAVEAIGDIASVRSTERRLAGGLAVLGLVVIPVAALGGRLLARRALAPIADLVRDTRALDPGSPASRLAVAPRTVEEVALLAESFNDVLGRLERAIENTRTFTADASHEIRNPLSALRTGLEVALRRERTPDDYRLLLRENLQEIDRLQAILEGLLTLARIEPGRHIPIQHERVDLERLLRETAGRLGVVADERGIAIEIDVASGLEVPGDERLLRLVVFNLLDNALKHGPDGEPVLLEARASGGTVRLRVTDRGPGVPPELRGAVFERYFRATADGASTAGGLGLSVVRWAAQAHGGSARVLDAGAGRGTSFEVELPSR